MSSARPSGDCFGHLAATGWGVLTEFRQPFGATQRVLADLWSAGARLRNAHNGEQLVLGTLGTVELACVQIAPSVSILDDVPYSPSASSRVYAGFLWQEGARLHRAAGHAVAPDWLLDVPGWIGHVGRSADTAPVCAVLHARLEPDILVAFPRSVTRRERVQQALDRLLSPTGPVAAAARNAPDLRVAVGQALDSVDVLLFAAGSRLETLGALAGAVRFATWRHHGGDEEWETVMLRALQATNAAGRLDDIPMFAASSTTIGLPITLSADPEAADTQYPGASRTASLKAPPNDAIVARNATVSSRLRFGPGDERRVRHLFPDDHTSRLFGPDQLAIRRWDPRADGQDLTSADLAGILTRGLHLDEDAASMGWSSIRSVTSFALEQKDTPADMQVGSQLRTALGEARARHLTHRRGLVRRWLLACRDARLPAATQDRGKQLILAVLRRVVANPELFAVPVPLTMDVVEAAEMLARERAVPNGPPRRTRRAHRLHQHIVTALGALEEFVDSHPVEDDHTPLQGRRAVRAGRAGDLLVVDAICAALRGLWDLVSETPPTFLVTYHHRSTLRARVVGDTTLLVAIPGGAAQRSIAAWDLIGVAGDAALHLVRLEPSGPRRHGLVLTDPAARQAWAELADAAALPPVGDRSLSDLLDRASAAAAQRYSVPWASAATTGLLRHVTVVRLAIRLVPLVSPEVRPWGVLGPNIARTFLDVARMEPERTPRLVALILLLATTDADCPATPEGVRTALHEVTDTLRRADAWFAPVHADRPLQPDLERRAVYERLRSLAEDCQLLPSELERAVAALHTGLATSETDTALVDDLARALLLADTVAARLRTDAAPDPALAEARAALGALLEGIQPRYTEHQRGYAIDGTWPPFLDLEELQPGSETSQEYEALRRRLAGRGSTEATALVCYLRAGGAQLARDVRDGSSNNTSVSDVGSRALDRLAAIGLPSPGIGLQRILTLPH